MAFNSLTRQLRRRLWPRSLLSRNLLILVALALVNVVGSASMSLFVQKIYTVYTGYTIGRHLDLASDLLANTPPGNRGVALSVLSANGFTVLPSLPSEGLTKKSEDTQLFKDFKAAVRSRLDEGVEVLWRKNDDGKVRVFVRMNVAGSPSWLSLSWPEDSRIIEENLQKIHLAIAISFMMPLFLAIFSGWLICRIVNVPLSEIVSAVQVVGRRDAPAKLRKYSTSEFSVISREFNVMVERLAQHERIRSIMLAGISHDIRTPLTILRLALDLDVAIDKTAALRSISQINSIISQMLIYGHGASKEAPAPGNMNILIEQLATDYENQGASFTLDLQPLATTLIYPVSMLRVLRNLMDNAVKYGRSGLEIRTRHDGDSLQISVLDRGPGIRNPNEMREPFVRGKAEQNDIVAGVGLGLAIVDRLLQAIGGRLTFFPRDFGGLEARIVLPAE